MKAPEKKQGIVIPANTYEAVLKAVREEMKAYGDEPPAPALRFVFDVSVDGVAVELSRTVTLACGKNANLRKDVSALVGPERFEAAIETDQAFTELVNSLLGMPVLVTTEVRTGLVSGNEYTNITAVMKRPGTAASASQAPAKKGLKSPARKLGPWGYDLSALPAEKFPRAQEFLQVAGAKKLYGHTWLSNTEIPQLVRYQVEVEQANVVMGEDEIPF
jgi:hypothetical protein